MTDATTVRRPAPAEEPARAASPETPPPSGSRQPRAGVALIAATSGVLGLLLAPLAFLGLFVRPTSDDWCLLPLGRDQGFGAVVNDVYRFENGRLGNGAVLGLIFTTYDVTSKALPGLMVAAFVAVFGALWHLLLRSLLGTSRRAAVAGASALAAALVIALLMGKLARYQTLYHAPTIVSHTMPLLIAATVALAVAALQRRSWRMLAGGTAFVGSAFLGTFNEAFTAVCLVTVTMLAVLHFAARRSVGRGVPLLPLAAAGVGLALGFLSVVTSPGSQVRRLTIQPRPLTDPELRAQTWHNWKVVAETAFTNGETALLLLAAVLVGLSTVAAPRWLRSWPSLAASLVVPLVWSLAASFGATFVLTYSFNGQLLFRERTWPSITITLLLTATWWGLLLGAAVRASAVGLIANLRWRRLVLGAGTLPILVGLVWAGGRLVRDEAALAQATVTRSVAWDAQDATVRAAVAAGASSVQVAPLKIDGLYEPFGQRGTWPASCLPSYYHVAEVTPGKAPVSVAQGRA